MPSSCPSSCSLSCISPCQQHCCQEGYPPNFSTQSPAICPSQCAVHCDGMRMCLAHCSSHLIRTIVIFNKINTNRKCSAKLFAVTKLCNTYTICPSFSSSYCSQSWPQYCCMGRPKVSIPIQNPGTNITGWKVSCSSRSGLKVVSYTSCVRASYYQVRKKDVCKIISAKKKSIKNQTVEYNENTTVKNLQQRATFKRCVTKRLWFILSVFHRIDKKIVTLGKIFNKGLFLNLKTVHLVFFAYN